MYGRGGGAGWFQHTAARRRLGNSSIKINQIKKFQHTAARRRLEDLNDDDKDRLWFQHTAARRRLEALSAELDNTAKVSTHSRPKAAGYFPKSDSGALIGFNTQPPEGGWKAGYEEFAKKMVSTHSRPKAAGNVQITKQHYMDSFNTQPPEGGWKNSQRDENHQRVSTHSRPKAAGKIFGFHDKMVEVSTHSRPKAAGASLKSLAPSGFVAPISLSSREKREREYNTAFSVTPAFAIS